MEKFNIIFNLIFLIVPILVLAGFIYTFVMLLSPKARGKMLKRNLHTMKYFYDENGELITKLNTQSANMSKEGIKITANAIKDGFTSDDGSIYCKKCGGKIDSDSAYCKHCGSEVE